MPDLKPGRLRPARTKVTGGNISAKSAATFNASFLLGATIAGSNPAGGSFFLRVLQSSQTLDRFYFFKSAPCSWRHTRNNAFHCNCDLWPLKQLVTSGARKVSLDEGGLMCQSPEDPEVVDKKLTDLSNDILCPCKYTMIWQVRNCDCHFYKFARNFLLHVV